MSQGENPIPADVRTTQPAPVPAPPPPQSQSQSQITEETIFDGSPSWMGRFKAFAITWIFALLLVIIPIILQVTVSGFPWWVIAAGVILALVLIVLQAAYHHTIRYRITNYRIDFERGLLTRRIDSLELWHADDLFFKQTLMERMAGVGSMDVISHDQTNPKLELTSIPNARETFERLKTCVLNAKRQRGLLQLDQ